MDRLRERESLSGQTGEAIKGSGKKIRFTAKDITLGQTVDHTKAHTKRIKSTGSACMCGLAERSTKVSGRRASNMVAVSSQIVRGDPESESGMMVNVYRGCRAVLKT